MYLVRHQFDKISPLIKNQSVDVKLDNNIIKVTSKQNRSTPGIKQAGIKIQTNTKYTFEVVGRSNCTLAALWVFQDITKTRIAPSKVSKVYLDGEFTRKQVEFSVKSSNKAYTNVSIGILFCDKFISGKSMIEIKSFNLIDTENLSLAPIQQPMITRTPQQQPVAMNINNDELYSKIKDVIQKVITDIKPAAPPQSTQIIGDFSTQSYGLPLISVIMTCYNSARYIKKAINSVLDQTYKNIELIIVDDRSQDNSLSVLRKYSNVDERIKVIQNLKNRGTYWSKNYGMMTSKGEYITFHDSDDFSDPTRLEKQYKAIISDDKYVACACNYSRIDKSGNLIINRGHASRLGLITLLIKKSVVKEIGYFDSVRVAADDEFIERIKSFYSKKRFIHITDVLYLASHNTKSLSTQEDAIDMTKQNDKEFLSNTRKEYQENFMVWHKKMQNKNKTPFVGFPLTRRHFPIDPSMNCDKGLPSKKDVITVSMCSIPSREKLLEKTIDSVIHQVDKINVYLNQYEDIPEFLSNPKINVMSSEYFEDLNDNGKFYFDLAPGYHFTIDDDILYPSNYISKMVHTLNMYDDQVIVGLHGTILNEDFNHFFTDRTILSFKHASPTHRFVNILGTGTVAYHTSVFAKKYDPSMKFAGMIDVWLAIEAKKLEIPMVCVDREVGWLVAQKNTSSINLYNHYMKKNMDKIKEFLCEKCMEIYKTHKYSQVVNCPDCGQIFKGIKDKEHTQYMKDQGSWILREQNSIKNLANHMFISNKYTKNIMKLNNVDVEILIEAMGKDNYKQIPEPETKVFYNSEIDLSTESNLTKSIRDSMDTKDFDGSKYHGIIIQENSNHQLEVFISNKNRLKDLINLQLSDIVLRPNHELTKQQSRHMLEQLKKDISNRITGIASENLRDYIKPDESELIRLLIGRLKEKELKKNLPSTSSSSSSNSSNVIRKSKPKTKKSNIMIKKKDIKV